ncbi:unnamed protein product [Rotaria sordida]|uniref:LamG-like jellyroll fold domain-containing protein n=1 Tax=Rotaria sordida TaxID=392033 RepID=A0A815QXQ8_9BILA|nr:unnamed protein product [Rotaria sordida]CAF1468355.1 unnamed protein product [Rotaria sordida]
MLPRHNARNVEPHQPISVWHTGSTSTIITYSRENSSKNNGTNKTKCKVSQYKPLLFGILIGGLVAGVGLAAILTLYLTQLSTQKSYMAILTTTTSTTTTTITMITQTTTTTTTTITTITSTTTTITTTTTSITTTTTTITTAITTTTSTTTSTSPTTTTTAAFIAGAFWPFDNNALELYNGLNSTLSGLPSYTTSFLGYGAAINLNQSLSQFVSITSMVIPLNSRSFTIEVWIYPIGLTGGEYGIFGQCQSTSTNLCLHFTSRNNKLYCGFYDNDVEGATTLTMNVWTHVACVYDSARLIQEVWLNGVLNGLHSGSPYQGLWGTTTIGATYSTGNMDSFNGYIDQVRFESRAKNSTELWNDASLYVYYSFNDGSLLDNGPNGINGTASGVLTSIIGRINRAIQFSSGSYIYYTYAPFYFLGINNHAFSISLWAQPTGSYAASTLVLVERSASWCVHFLVMNSAGYLSAHLWNGSDVGTNGPILPLNSWTHIGYTYSLSNGIQLYINGALYSTTGGFSFSASGVPTYMILGNDEGLASCTPGFGGPFTGAFDEFYVHNCELTASQVSALANP